MSKKLLIFILLILYVTIVTACTMSTNNIDTTDNNSMSKDVTDISIVRENAKSDYENAKTKYNNLKFSNIIPYCTPLDKVYDIENYELDNYKGITDEKEMYEEQMKLINHYIGTDLDDRYFGCGYYDFDTDEYDTFTEFKEDLFNGKKMDATWLGYYDNTYDGQERKEFRYAEILRTLINVYFDDGELEKSKIVNEYEENNEVASYYVFNDDDNLEDVYMLKDGEISIKEAIKEANNYINNELMIEGNENVSLQVVKVEVHKLDDECYYYRFIITRNIYGLLVRTSNGAYSTQNPRNILDITYACMINKGKINSYYGRTTRLNGRTINETDKIISLDTALKHISESIGENSVYKIIGVEMAYINENVEELTSNRSTMTASWLVKSISDLDNSYTDFYVNLRTGDVKVYQYYELE